MRYEFWKGRKTPFEIAWISTDLGDRSDPTCSRGRRVLKVYNVALYSNPEAQ